MANGGYCRLTLGLARCIYIHTMAAAQLKRYNFHIGLGQLGLLRAVQERDGIDVAEQIRRAIDDWLKKKGITEKSERLRAGTRKRP